MEGKKEILDDGNKPVPERIEDFTPQWCEWALKSSGTIGTNATVISADIKRLVDETTGVTDGGGCTDAQIFRIKLIYGGEIAGNEPNTVIAKWFYNLTMKLPLKWRLICRLTGQYGGGLEENIFRSDIMFCREVIPLIKDTFQYSKVYYTGMVDRGNRNVWNGTIMNKPCNVKSITLMQDMDGWESSSLRDNFLKGGLDPVTKKACLINIAVLHAAFWGKKAEKIKHAFRDPSVQEGKYRGAAHKFQAARSRISAIASVQACRSMIQKCKTAWESYAWMAVKKEVTMPSWFTAETLEDGSYPILKDREVLEMLDVFAERYPSFNEEIASAYMKKPMQTLLHGDFHAGNHMYGVNNDKGKIVVLDFQLVGMGMVAVDICFFFGYQATVSDFIPMAKVYHDALVKNGVDDYTWEEFKKDMIIQQGEFVLKLVKDFAAMPPEKFLEFLNIFGEKSASIRPFLECGAYCWPIIILTDIYVKNKEGFLNKNSFSDI